MVDLKRPLCPFCEECEGLVDEKDVFILLVSDDGKADLYIQTYIQEIEDYTDDYQTTFQFTYCPVCGRNLITGDDDEEAK